MSGKAAWSLWLSATAAFTIIGCTWAFAIARYGGPDEPAHVIRAAAVAGGDFVGRPVPGFEPGYRAVTVPAALASGDPACFRHAEDVTAACAVATDGSVPTEVATSAGNAPPWYYVIVGLMARALSSGRSVLAYRMATVLCCAVVLGLAMARSRRFCSAWTLAALTPSTWFLTGVVGTSGIEVALITVAVVEAVRRIRESDDARAGVRSLLSVTVPLAVCLVLRPAAAIDIAVVALVVVPTLPRPVRVRPLLVAAAPIAAAGVATIAWDLWAGLVLKDQRTADTRSIASALAHSVSGLPKTAHQAIGALGWNEFFAPLAAQVVWVVVLAIAVQRVVTRSPTRWWHVRWLVAALALPTIAEVVAHRRLGEIWQGRYSIPFAIAGVLYAGGSAQPSWRVRRAIVAAAACAEVLSLWWTLRRYMVGLDGSLLLTGASWHPAANAWLLLSVNAAAVLWLGWLASSGDVGEGVDDVLGGAGVVVDRQLTT